MLHGEALKNLLRLQIHTVAMSRKTDGAITPKPSLSRGTGKIRLDNILIIETQS